MLERRKGLDVPPGVGTVRDRIAFRRQTDNLEAMLFRINRWWDTRCRQLGLNPKADIWQDFGYHIAELVKNGLIMADQVKVYSVSSPGAIGIVVEDNGPGLKDPLTDVELSTGQGYGLQGAIDFADRIVIESRGRRFEKVSSDGSLAPHGSTQLPGTRVALFKKRPATRR